MINMSKVIIVEFQKHLEHFKINKLLILPLFSNLCIEIFLICSKVFTDPQQDSYK